MRHFIQSLRCESGLGVFLVALALVALGAPPVAAQNGGGAASAGVQEYYVPGTQAQMLDLFNDLLADLTTTAYVSSATGQPLTTAGEFSPYI